MRTAVPFTPSPPRCSAKSATTSNATSCTSRARFPECLAGDRRPKAWRTSRRPTRFSGSAGNVRVRRVRSVKSEEIERGGSDRQQKREDGARDDEEAGRNPEQSERVIHVHSESMSCKYGNSAGGARPGPD